MVEARDADRIQADFALFNVRQLVTLAPEQHSASQGELGVIENAALAARDGKIVWIGPSEELRNRAQLLADATLVDAHGRTALPGFVDPHTHPVFAGKRLRDFYSRSRGVTYEDQLEIGGIMETVRATRAASEDELLTLSFKRCETFLRYGTTTIGAKSGYGLTEADELKSLRVLTRLQHLQALKIVPTFLGAHVVPRGRQPSEFVDDVLKWLPGAREHAIFADVWCESEAFTPDQCRVILEKARDLGFELTGHANELGPTGGIKTLVDIGVASIDHAVYVDDEEFAALRESDVVVVALPGTTLFLNTHTFMPARRLLDADIRVALGTDFNPGTCYTQNMQFILTLGVLELGMTAEEVLKAATLDAARALKMEHRVGSLETGKFCDVALFAVDHYSEIPYNLAMNLVDTVVANGRVVVCDGELTTNPSPFVAS